MTRSKPHQIDLHGLHIEQALARFSHAYTTATATSKGVRLIVIHGWNASDFRSSIAAALHRLLKNRLIDFEYPFDGNRGRTGVQTGPPLDKHHAKSSTPKPTRKSGSLRGGL